MDRRAVAAAASWCAIPVDDEKDDDSESKYSLPPGGEKAAPAPELTLMLALIPRSPERRSDGRKKQKMLVVRRENRAANFPLPTVQ